MRKIMVCAIVAWLAVAAVAWACAYMVVCPYDGARATHNGYVTCDNGHMACRYYCSRGHWLQEPCE